MVLPEKARSLSDRQRIALAALLVVALVVYPLLFFQQMVMEGDIDHRRLGVHHNELFFVEHNHSPPYIFFFAITLVPLLLWGFLRVFFGSPLQAWYASALFSTPVRTASSGSVAFALSAFFMWRVMSSYSLICAYRQDEFDRLCTFTHSVVESLQAEHGPGSVWLQNGTLLGAIRKEETNYLIRNDHDMDICFDRRLGSVNVRESLRRMGVLYERFSNPVEHHDNHLRVYPPWLSLHAGHSGPLMIEVQACTPEAGGLFNVTGCNGLPWAAPVEHERVLLRVFGATWRTPRTDNHYGLCWIFPNS